MMETGKYHFKAVWFITLFAAHISVVEAVEGPAIAWNKMAESQIINKNELNKLGAAFPNWQIKQVTWPSSAELASNSVTVGDKLKLSCIGWLQKFMKKENLPSGLDKRLVAMKGWGLFTAKSEQKSLCDVFIVRYKKGPHVVQIQESPFNVVITVSDERLVKSAREDHKQLVIETATSLLNDALKADPNSENLHVFEIVRDEQKISGVSWLVESVIGTDKDGKKYTNLQQACKIGTGVVEAKTDGRFVRFDIYKSIPGARAVPDPYAERFGPRKEPVEQRYCVSATAYIVIGMAAGTGMLLLVLLLKKKASSCSK